MKDIDPDRTSIWSEGFIWVEGEFDTCVKHVIPESLSHDHTYLLIIINNNKHCSLHQFLSVEYDIFIFIVFVLPLKSLCKLIRIVRDNTCNYYCKNSTLVPPFVRSRIHLLIQINPKPTNMIQQHTVSNNNHTKEK